MTKSQKRAIAHQQRQASQSTNIERNESGHLTTVRTRTSLEEYRHACAMDRWARRGGGGDFDYTMNY